MSMWIIPPMLFELLLLLQLSTVQSDVSLQYEVKNYKNLENLNNRLRKCESFNFFYDNCDPLFHFAAFILDRKGDPVVSLRREAGPFVDLKSIASVLNASHVHRTFPELVEIELDVIDNDLVEDERIALFRRKIPIDKIGNYEVSMGTDVSVDIVIAVKCADDFYGDRCDVYCKPIPGLWKCNNITGSRECSKFCAQGSCQLTMTSVICICSSGWVGEHCDRAVDRDVISSLVIPDPVYSDEGISEEFTTHDGIQPVVVEPSKSVQTLATEGTQPPRDAATEQREASTATSTSTAGLLIVIEPEEPGIPATQSPEECNTTGVEAGGSDRPSNCSEWGEKSAAIRSASGAWSYQTKLVIPLVATLLVVTLMAIVSILFWRWKKPESRRKLKSIFINPTYQSSKARYLVPHKYENGIIPLANQYNYLPKTLPTRRGQTHMWQSRSLGRHQQYPLPQTPSHVDRYSNGDERENLRKLRFATPKYSDSTSTTALTSASRTMSYEPPSTVVSSLATGKSTVRTMVSPSSYEELPNLGRGNDEYDIWEHDEPASVKLSSFS